MVLSEGGTLATFFTAACPSITFTMALQVGNINVSATVWDRFDLPRVQLRGS